jgi:transketolase
VFSRQNLPFQQRGPELAAEIRRGGYVLVEPSGEPHAVIIATGSEVSLAVEAQKLLTQQGIAVRVVSMPSTTVFDRQDSRYRDSVLPPLLPTVAVEAGVSDLWHKYVGRTGGVVGIDRFGESAPAGELFKLFGLTSERVAKAVRGLLA